MPKIKTQFKNEAINLLRKGYSRKEIARLLPVAKSTLSNWLRHMSPSKKGKLRVQRKRAEARKRGSELASEYHRQQRAQEFKEAEEYFAELTPTVGTLALVGAALYWAEGATYGDFKFCDSDPQMIRLYLRWLRTILQVPAENISCKLNVYLNNGMSYRKVRRHWELITDIPAERFKKPTINHTPTSSSGKKIGKLPYGTISVRVVGPRKYIAKYAVLAKMLGHDIQFVEKAPSLP